MPIEDHAWDIDRLPTKTERIVGIFVATFLLLLTSALLSFVTYRLYLAGELDGDSEWLFAISLLLFLLTVVLLWRIAFTKPSRPRRSAISFTGYVMLGSGVALLFLSAIYGPSSAGAVWVGLIAVGAGVALVKKYGKRPREP